MARHRAHLEYKCPGTFYYFIPRRLGSQKSKTSQIPYRARQSDNRDIQFMPNTILTRVYMPTPAGPNPHDFIQSEPFGAP